MTVKNEIKTIYTITCDRCKKKLSQDTPLLHKQLNWFMDNANSFDLCEKCCVEVFFFIRSKLPLKDIL